MIKKSDKIYYLIIPILAISIFNLHFGTQQTCEQINHHECRSLTGSNENKTPKEECCSASRNDESDINENNNLENLDDCNCFHLTEHDAEQIISVKNFEIYSYPHIISRLNISTQNQKDLLSSIEKKRISFEEVIPTILKTESFLI